MLTFGRIFSIAAVSSGAIFLQGCGSKNKESSKLPEGIPELNIEPGTCNGGLPADFLAAAESFKTHFDAATLEGRHKVAALYEDDAVYVAFQPPPLSHLMASGTKEITKFWEDSLNSAKSITFGVPDAKQTKGGPVHRAQLSDTEIVQMYDSYEFKDSTGKRVSAGAVLVELWRKSGDAWKMWRDITVLRGFEQQEGVKTDPRKLFPDDSELLVDPPTQARKTGRAQYVGVSETYVVNIHKNSQGKYMCDAARLDMTKAMPKVELVGTDADLGVTNGDWQIKFVNGKLSVTSELNLIGGETEDLTLVAKGEADEYTRLSALPSQIRWVVNFNSGNGEGCGNAYTTDAKFVAFDFPKVGGPAEVISNQGNREATTALWKKFTAQYHDMKAPGMRVQVLSANEIVASYSQFSWTDKTSGTENAVFGNILGELWVQNQDDGWLVHRDIVRIGSNLVPAS